MTNRTWFLAALFLSALLGLTAGNITRTTTVKAVTVDGFVWMNPGATSTLTCVWHGECQTPTAGVALDWSNSGGASVYFRGFGATVSGTVGSVGTGRALTSNTGCYRIRLEIKDPLGTFRASGLYTHTDQPQGGTFTIAAGTLGSPAYTSVVIGKTRDLK